MNMKKISFYRIAAIVSAAVCLLCFSGCSKEDGTDYDSVVDSINFDEAYCNVSLYGPDMDNILLDKAEVIETANDFLLNVTSNELTEPYDHKSDDFPVGAPFVKLYMINGNKRAYIIDFTFFSGEDTGKVDIRTDDGDFTYSVDNQDIAKFYYYITDQAQEALNEKAASA